MSNDSAESGIGTIATDESVCLDVSIPYRTENNSKVYMSACIGSEKQKWHYSPQVETKLLRSRLNDGNLCGV